jgi:opacity protein-like surface antigen
MDGAETRISGLASACPTWHIRRASMTGEIAVFRSGLCLFAAIFASGALAADATKPAFDVPLKVISQPLPANQLNPTTKPALTCSYYAHFMVKQVDLGDQGAGELSVLSGDSPACQRENQPNEVVIPPKQWSGYFRGVIGDNVFFVGSSTFAGGKTFAVFSPDGKKIFTDNANGFVSSVPGAGVALNYRRVFDARCSIVGSQSKACMKHIREATGLAKLPDCKALYLAKLKDLPFGIETETAVEYSARLLLDEGKSRIVPIAGDASTCHPVVTE